MTERFHSFAAAARNFRDLRWCMALSLVVGLADYAVRTSKLNDSLQLQLSLPALAMTCVVVAMACVYVTRLEDLFSSPTWLRYARSARAGGIAFLVASVGAFCGRFMLRQGPIPELGIACALVSRLVFIVGGFVALLRTIQMSGMVVTMIGPKSESRTVRHVIHCAWVLLVGCLFLYILVNVFKRTDMHGTATIFSISVVPVVILFGLYSYIRYLLLLQSIINTLFRAARNAAS